MLGLLFLAGIPLLVILGLIGLLIKKQVAGFYIALVVFIVAPLLIVELVHEGQSWGPGALGLIPFLFVLMMVTIAAGIVAVLSRPTAILGIPVWIFQIVQSLIAVLVGVGLFYFLAAFMDVRSVGILLTELRGIIILGISILISILLLIRIWKNRPYL